eukprot:2926746-Amphidinium_carterae.1
MILSQLYIGFVVVLPGNQTAYKRRATSYLLGKLKLMSECAPQCTTVLRTLAASLYNWKIAPINQHINESVQEVLVTEPDE